MFVDGPVVSTFALVKALAAHPERMGSAAQVKERLDAALAEVELACTAEGVEQADIDDLLFALCAFADEVLLESHWKDRKSWIGRSLQRTRFDTLNAGEEFFTRLERLLAGKGTPKSLLGSLESPGRETPQALSSCTPALGVYAVALALGFTGRWFQEKDKAVLASWRDRALAAAFGGRTIPPLLKDAEHTLKRGRKRFWRGLDPVDAIMVFAPLVVAALLFVFYGRVLSQSLKGFLGVGG